MQGWSQALLSGEPKRLPREAFALASFLRAGAWQVVNGDDQSRYIRNPSPIPLYKGSTSQVRGHEQRSQGQCLAHRTGQMTGNGNAWLEMTGNASWTATDMANTMCDTMCEENEDTLVVEWQLTFLSFLSNYHVSLILYFFYSNQQLKITFIQHFLNQCTKFIKWGTIV